MSEQVLKKAAFHTLGCKVNAYETEAMEKQLEEAGYEISSFSKKADVYVINTCSVTDVADKKSRQMLHRARTLNPNAVVIAAGCYAKAAGDILKSETGVDLVLDNTQKNDIAKILEQYLENRNNKEKPDLTETKTHITGSGYKDEKDTKNHYTRAFLKIQDGCNQFCSYCIIPFVRGRETSRDVSDIMTEAQELAKRGFRELVLTGIHISSYYGSCNLSDLAKELSKVRGIERIRFGSLEPEIIDDDFVKSLKSNTAFCPHFHMSLQSGSDNVLKRMNRHYTAGDYLKRVDIVRKYFPDAAITTDIIVGFPGESKEEFDETLRFAQKVGFYEIHVFPYSKRKGTKAAAMEGQLTRSQKAKRVAELIDEGKMMSKKYRESKRGLKQEVLLEESFMADGEEYMVGNTPEYVRVAVKSRENLKNRIIMGEITSFLTPEIMKIDKILNIR